MEYFDPPAKHGANPKLVGCWPCAVFGIAALDGRWHAHRIYLSPDGWAKADLGIGSDGKPRDAKKSAKLAPGQPGISGCAVIWGDPDTAPHLVLFEGIENAAVGAYDLRAEIDAGEVYIASAINAGGIEAFVPWPATKKVTVAADRDEAKDGSGYQRGEKAAREFALRRHESVEVRIALPGLPGESVDWLDILRRDGIGAVRAGVLAAIPFAPTEDEIAERDRARDLASEIDQIAETYPLPHLLTLLVRYRRTDDGRIWVHKFEGLDQEGNERWTPICSPFGTTARLRHNDQGNAYGVRCLVQDMDGRPRTVDFDRSNLPRMAASEIRAAFFAAGLRTEGKGEMIAVDCLKGADPKREIIIVSRPGWQEVPGLTDPVFVCPNGEVIGADGSLIELVGSTRMAPDIAVAGTRDGWQHAIEEALQCGCPHWVLGIAAGFVGPLISLIGLDTCGVNFSGLSSSGKTTAQRLAASAWSTSDIRRPGLAQSARATDNAIEALAYRATGTVLVLDELAHISGKDAAQFIYTIAGGVGKRRMTPDAVIRDSYSWSTFAILSAESSLEETIRADGGEWRAGMAVRIVDIDVSVGINRQVDAVTFDLINQIERHHGHAGPAFVNAMISEGLHRQALSLKNRILAAAAQIAGDGADSAKRRAALPFALLLIAGELAKAFGIVPTWATISEAVIWAWGRFQQSSDSLALDPEAQAIANLRRWIAERWDVSLKDTKAQGGVNNRDAVAWYDATTIYIPKETIREATGNILKESHIGAMLDRRGLLAKRAELDRFCIRWVPHIGKVICYALRRLEFGRSDLVVDPEAFTVHQDAADA